MSDLEALLNDLANQEAAANPEGIRQTRQRLVAEFPDSEQAAEAQYKIGLDILFSKRDIQAALECFKAAMAKKHPFWSVAARISMALCIFRQGDPQKALLELGKAAYPVEPTPNSITALTFIELICEETKNKEQGQRVRKERINQLKKILKQVGDGEHQAKAHYLHQLGLEHQRDGDFDQANRLFNQALEMGEAQIGGDLYSAIKALLP